VRARLIKMLAFAATFAVAILVVFPLLFGPSVDKPVFRFPDNPFWLEVRISNENLTPLTNVEYDCTATDVELANGTKLPDVAVVNQGHIRRIQGRKAITARCETSYIINAPVKRAEFKLTLKYRSYPWPNQHSEEYRFVATLDDKGHVTGWDQKKL
jgi:hypothetical protein